MSARARLIERGRDAARPGAPAGGAASQTTAPGASLAAARLASPAAAAPLASAGGGARLVSPAAAPVPLASPGVAALARALPAPAAVGAGPRPADVALPGAAAATAGPLAFALLALFLAVLYTRPQDLVPALVPLRLAFLLGAGAAALHAVDALRRGVPVVRPGREVCLIGALVALGVCSIPLSLWPGGSFAILADRLAKVALAFVLIAHLVDTLARARALVAVLVAAGVFLAVGSLYALATGEATTYGGRAEGLVGGMFRDPNDLALSLVVMMALAGFQVVSARRLPVRALYVAAIAVMLAGCLATFSRGGLLALLCAAAVGVRRLARHGRGLAVAGLLSLAVLGALLAPEGYSDRATSIVTREGDTGSIEARLTTLRYGLEILVEHPVVGVGLGSFRIAEGEKHGGVGKWNEAHNTFIQVGAEIGWAGLAVYLALAACALANARAAARAAAGDARLAAFAHGLETALAGFLVGALFLSQAYTWHFYVLLGLSVAARQIAAGRQAAADQAAPAAPAGRPVRLGARGPVVPVGVR